MSDPPCPMIGDELPSAYPHIKELAPGIGSIVDPVAGVGSIVNMLLGGDDSTSSTGGRNLQDSNQDVLQTLEIACGTRFTRSYAKITQKPKCECQNRPWAGSYWAVAQDSIKHHWAGPGTDSIVTKYSKAFGLDEKHLADAVSYCNTVDDCKSSKHVSRRCSRRNSGSTEKGVGIPHWPGICHGWAVASILELEPLCPVTVRGVKFEIQDIKGLLSFVYQGSTLLAAYAGNRAEKKNADRDVYGRPKLLSVRDISAGDFLIAIVNIVCILKKSVIIDRVPTSEVWNQPVTSVEIIDHFYVDPVKVSRKAFKVEKSPFNERMKRLTYMTIKVYWVDETDQNTVTTSDDVYHKYQNHRTFSILVE